jgi:hypothetical protein
MSKMNPIYLAAGTAIGTAVGVETNNIGLWLAVGVAIGAAMAVSFKRTDSADKDEDES